MRLVSHTFGRHEDGIAVGLAVVGRRVAPGGDDAAVHDLGVGVAEGVASADVGNPAALSSQVVRHLPGISRLLDLVRRRHRLERHHVVVVAPGEVLRCRLPVDQAPALDGSLLRVRSPADGERGLLPDWRLMTRDQHSRVGLAEQLVPLELASDLLDEGFCDAARVAEDADRHLGIVQDLLNDASVGDDRRLVVLTCPQIQVVVGLELDLSTAIVEPGVQHVGALEHVGQHVEPIDGGQIAPVRLIEARLDVDIEIHRLIEVRAVEVAILHHLDQVGVNPSLYRSPVKTNLIHTRLARRSTPPCWLSKARTKG